MIDSFEISLEAERKSPKTVRTYTEAAQWLAGAHLLPAGMTDWEAVTARDVQRWIIAAYSDTYANNQFRALQQFFKWLSAEDPERPLPNPMAGLKPPKVDEKLVPVLAAAELAALLATCKGGGYAPRRYLRERARHRMAGRPALWLGSRSGGPMTPGGIYQMVCRRGEQAGVEANPHKFRHNFSHSWLDKGCAEGDLMELNGWTSPQMLRRYGRSAASSRARRSYDRIMDAS